MRAADFPPESSDSNPSPRPSIVKDIRSLASLQEDGGYYDDRHDLPPPPPQYESPIANRLSPRLQYASPSYEPPPYPRYGSPTFVAPPPPPIPTSPQYGGAALRESTPLTLPPPPLPASPFTDSTRGIPRTTLPRISPTYPTELPVQTQYHAPYASPASNRLPAPVSLSAMAQSPVGAPHMRLGAFIAKASDVDFDDEELSDVYVPPPPPAPYTTIAPINSPPSTILDIRNANLIAQSLNKHDAHLSSPPPPPPTRDIPHMAIQVSHVLPPPPPPPPAPRQPDRPAKTQASLDSPPPSPPPPPPVMDPAAIAPSGRPTAAAASAGMGVAASHRLLQRLDDMLSESPVPTPPLGPSNSPSANTVPILSLSGASAQQTKTNAVVDKNLPTSPTHVHNMTSPTSNQKRIVETGGNGGIKSSSSRAFSFDDALVGSVFLLYRNSDASSSDGKDPGSGASWNIRNATLLPSGILELRAFTERPIKSKMESFSVKNASIVITSPHHSPPSRHICMRFQLAPASIPTISPVEKANSFVSVGTVIDLAFPISTSIRDDPELVLVHDEIFVSWLLALRRLGCAISVLPAYLKDPFVQSSPSPISPESKKLNIMNETRTIVMTEDDIVEVEDIHAKSPLQKLEVLRNNVLKGKSIKSSMGSTKAISPSTSASAPSLAAPSLVPTNIDKKLSNAPQGDGRSTTGPNRSSSRMRIDKPTMAAPTQLRTPQTFNSKNSGAADSDVLVRNAPILNTHTDNTYSSPVSSRLPNLADRVGVLALPALTDFDPIQNRIFAQDKKKSVPAVAPDYQYDDEVLEAHYKALLQTLTPEQPKQEKEETNSVASDDDLSMVSFLNIAERDLPVDSVKHANDTRSVEIPYQRANDVARLSMLLRSRAESVASTDSDNSDDHAFKPLQVPARSKSNSSIALRLQDVTEPPMYQSLVLSLDDEAVSKSSDQRNRTESMQSYVTEEAVVEEGQGNVDLISSNNPTMQREGALDRAPSEFDTGLFSTVSYPQTGDIPVTYSTYSPRRDSAAHGTQDDQYTYTIPRDTVARKSVPGVGAAANVRHSIVSELAYNGNVDDDAASFHIAAELDDLPIPGLETLRSHVYGHNVEGFHAGAEVPISSTEKATIAAVEEPKKFSSAAVDYSSSVPVHTTSFFTLSLPPSPWSNTNAITLFLYENLMALGSLFSTLPHNLIHDIVKAEGLKSIGHPFFFHNVPGGSPSSDESATETTKSVQQEEKYLTSVSDAEFSRGQSEADLSSTSLVRMALSRVTTLVSTLVQLSLASSSKETDSSSGHVPPIKPNISSPLRSEKASGTPNADLVNNGDDGQNDNLQSPSKLSNHEKRVHLLSIVPIPFTPVLRADLILIYHAVRLVWEKQQSSMRSHERGAESLSKTLFLDLTSNFALLDGLLAHFSRLLHANVLLVLRESDTSSVLLLDNRNYDSEDDNTPSSFSQDNISSRTQTLNVNGVSDAATQVTTPYSQGSRNAGEILDSNEDVFLDGLMDDIAQNIPPKSPAPKAKVSAPPMSSPNGDTPRVASLPARTAPKSPISLKEATAGKEMGNGESDNTKSETAPTDESEQGELTLEEAEVIHKASLLRFYQSCVPSKANSEQVDVSWTLFGPSIWEKLARDYGKHLISLFRPRDSRLEKVAYKYATEPFLGNRPTEASSPVQTQGTSSFSNINKPNLKLDMESVSRNTYSPNLRSPANPPDDLRTPLSHAQRLFLSLNSRGNLMEDLDTTGYSDSSPVASVQRGAYGRSPLNRLNTISPVAHGSRISPLASRSPPSRDLPKRAAPPPSAASPNSLRNHLASPLRVNSPSAATAFFADLPVSSGADSHVSERSPLSGSSTGLNRSIRTNNRSPLTLDVHSNVAPISPHRSPNYVVSGIPDGFPPKGAGPVAAAETPGVRRQATSHQDMASRELLSETVFNSLLDLPVLPLTEHTPVVGQHVLLSPVVTVPVQEGEESTPAIGLVRYIGELTIPVEVAEHYKQLEFEQQEVHRKQLEEVKSGIRKSEDVDIPAPTGAREYLESLKGIWYGVELYAPIGTNDGTILGIEYFHCMGNTLRSLKAGTEVSLPLAVFVRKEDILGILQEEGFPAQDDRSNMLSSNVEYAQSPARRSALSHQDPLSKASHLSGRLSNVESDGSEDPDTSRSRRREKKRQPLYLNGTQSSRSSASRSKEAKGPRKSKSPHEKSERPAWNSAKWRDDPLKSKIAAIPVLRETLSTEARNTEVSRRRQKRTPNSATGTEMNQEQYASDRESNDQDTVPSGYSSSYSLEQFNSGKPISTSRLRSKSMSNIPKRSPSNDSTQSSARPPRMSDGSLAKRLASMSPFSNASTEATVTPAFLQFLSKNKLFHLAPALSGAIVMRRIRRALKKQVTEQRDEMIQSPHTHAFEMRSPSQQMIKETMLREQQYLSSSVGLTDLLSFLLSARAELYLELPHVTHDELQALLRSAKAEMLRLGYTSETLHAAATDSEQESAAAYWAGQGNAEEPRTPFSANTSYSQFGSLSSADSPSPNLSPASPSKTSSRNIRLGSSIGTPVSLSPVQLHLMQHSQSEYDIPHSVPPSRPGSASSTASAFAKTSQMHDSDKSEDAARRASFFPAPESSNGQPERVNNELEYIMAGMAAVNKRLGNLHSNSYTSISPSLATPNSTKKHLGGNESSNSTDSEDPESILGGVPWEMVSPTPMSPASLAPKNKSASRLNLDVESIPFNTGFSDGKGEQASSKTESRLNSSLSGAPSEELDTDDGMSSVPGSPGLQISQKSAVDPANEETLSSFLASFPNSLAHLVPVLDILGVQTVSDLAALDANLLKELELPVHEESALLDIACNLPK